ncbi:MAG: hypothetical protein JNL21_40880 [Myxococcales bacterium]|nr:hypothetical protein [Myxococcales bacterium]
MPYLGSTVFVGALCMLLLTSLTGFFLLLRSVASSFVDRAEHAAATRPLACALLGFPASFAGIGLTIAMTNAGAGPVRAGGLLGLGLVAGLMLAGVAGLAQRVGGSLGGAEGASPALRLLRGAIVLELAMLLPIVGWLLVLPLGLAIGTGAACLALVRVGARAPLPAVTRVS